MMPPNIATDRTGRYLLGASYPGHKVSVNPIGPPGTVQPPQQIDPASGALTKLKAYPMGRNPDWVEIVDL